MERLWKSIFYHWQGIGWSQTRSICLLFCNGCWCQLFTFSSFKKINFIYNIFVDVSLVICFWENDKNLSTVLKLQDFCNFQNNTPIFDKCEKSILMRNWALQLKGSILVRSYQSVPKGIKNFSSPVMPDGYFRPKNRQLNSYSSRLEYHKGRKPLCGISNM